MIWDHKRKKSTEKSSDEVNNRVTRSITEICDIANVKIATMSKIDNAAEMDEIWDELLYEAERDLKNGIGKVVALLSGSVDVDGDDERMKEVTKNLQTQSITIMHMFHTLKYCKETMPLVSANAWKNRMK